MKSSPISLLIVDDDPVFSRFLRQLVAVLDAELACAATSVDTAEKALEELGGGHYDLALLDYNLPGADGLKLLDAIQALPSSQQPAVIMLTASGSETVAVEAMKRGAKDYLPKAHLDVPPLTRAIKSALAQKRLADQLEAFNSQLKADMAMARNLQQSLLPDAFPCFPRSAPPEESALRFCYRFEPSTDLAGDLFSVLGLSDSLAGVFICDVMGHGVRSALVTAILRAILDDLAPRLTDPGQFLSEMNRKLTRLLHHTETPLYATAFYLTVDSSSGLMAYSSAGHPTPLHLRRNAGTAAPLTLAPGRGPALGLFSEASYPTCQCSVEKGDLVLLFTDGLFEVVDADEKQEYGQKKLLAAVRERLGVPSARLLDELLSEAQAFAGGSAFDDDVCLLGIEMTP